MVNIDSRPVRGGHRVVLNDTLELARHIVEAIAPGSNLSTADFMSVVRGETRCLADRPMPNPHDYTCADNFHRDYILYNLLRKFPYLPGKNPKDRAALALAKLRECEAKCKATNRSIDLGLTHRGYNHALNLVLNKAKGKIARVLGSFCWNSVMEHVDFGPGATTRLPRSKSDVLYKIGGALHLTEPCVPLFLAFQDFCPGLFEDFKVVTGNKIITVPKDSKIDRPIAIEPDFNMFVQKGIGTLIRDRLKSRSKEKIDLRDQSHNQMLAKLASLGFNLATVDLSSASDTVSSRLVEELLPSDWFEALCVTRSHSGTFPDGEVIHYQKWSSMGNGYTFELESLIFWALAKACIDVYGNGSEYVSVYGDDIVITSSLYSSFVDVLEMTGFSVNLRKSFYEGPFYESCGKHYFKGRDVSPLYLDEIPSSLQQLVALTNEIILLSGRLGGGLYRDKSLYYCVDFLRKFLPPNLRRPKAPVEMKGNALIGDFDECTPRRSRTVCGWVVHGLATRNDPISFSDDPVVLRKSLYLLGFRRYTDETPSAEITLMKRKNFMKKMTVREWSYLGPIV